MACWPAGIVARLVVQDGTTTNANPFVNGQQWNISAVRPAYLQDLRSYNGSVIPFFVHIAVGSVNHVAWDAKVPLATFPYGSVVEMTLEGTPVHPFHLHVWHMQVLPLALAAVQWGWLMAFSLFLCISANGCDVCIMG